MALAGWGSRVGAYLLDGILRLLLAAALFGLLIAADSVGGAVDAAGTVVFGASLLMVYVGYGSYLTRRPGPRNGQTWGKQIMGIRAVRDGGQPYTAGSAVLRELVVKDLLFGLIASIALSIPWLLDSLWPLWDDSNRALHDMIVRSHVVQA